RRAWSPWCSSHRRSPPPAVWIRTTGSHGLVCTRLTRIDWLIVAFTVVMATVGWRQGFVAGAFALVGFAGGAFLGARIGPALLSDGSSSPYAPLVALIFAVTG